VSSLLVALLKAYRVLISPLYGQVCRYYPSCSAYALGAIETHGAVKGCWLALRRLGRCHPWTPGGVDLVPARSAYRWWGRAAGVDGSPTEQESPSTTVTMESSAVQAPVRQGA
jgi:uncharacterized protein